jgi:hypothetical protein
MSLSALIKEDLEPSVEIGSITNGETIHSNEFLGQIATNFQDNHAVTEAIAKNGQFKYSSLL